MYGREVRLGGGHTPPCTPQYVVPVGPNAGVTKYGKCVTCQIWKVQGMLDVCRGPAAGAHTCAGVNATQATRWSALARTLGLAHARALGRCSTFAAADHTEARDPAPRTASPGRARTVAQRCTRVRVRVGGAGRMRVQALSAKSGFPDQEGSVQNTGSC